MPRSLLVHIALAGWVTAGAVPLASQQPTRQRDVITAEEIEPLQVEDAYQVVLRLRPEFFRHASRSQMRSALPAMGEETGDRAIGARPSLSTTRIRGGAEPGSREPPDPNAPEFNREGASGRATSRGDAGGGGGVIVGPDPGMGVAGPLRADESLIAVYVGSVLYGGIEELTRLPAAEVKEIRYLSPSEAHFRFGPRHSAGVILVTLK